jgi:ParB/RepB/Spo0J family partition protein
MRRASPDAAAEARHGRAHQEVSVSQSLSTPAPAHRETRGIGILIDELVPAAWNPRRSFDDLAQADLVASIRAHGILTPLLVRPLARAKDEGRAFEVIAGARRLRAAKTVGLESVPCTVREMSDDQAREVAIIENLQREDLAPLDEAHAYQQLLSRADTELATLATIAAKVGKSVAYVSRRVKLLSLIPEVQEPLREGRLSVAHAELLAKLQAADQVYALRDAIWLPMYTAGEIPDDDRTTAFLQPIASLRKWIGRHTALNLASLADDPESRELFPEAAAEVDGFTAGAVQELLEVALDAISSGAIPDGVLKPDKDFKWVLDRRCDQTERAIVVFGSRRGEVVSVCRAKRTCKTHWPPKAKVDKTRTSEAPRQSWQEQEADRKRRQAIWDRVRPAAYQAVIAATKKVQSTPKLLRSILTDQEDQALVDIAIKGVGSLNPLTFARVWTIVEALRGMYSPEYAQDRLDEVGAKFDVAKAMKGAGVVSAAPANPNTKAIAKALTRVRKTTGKR